MAQKGLMRILSRRDGKSMVSDDKDSEKVKLTKALEFVPARKPEQAKLGEVVRFMYNPGNGQSAYWMQGTLEKRLDKYKVAKESNFTRNRFKVNKLSIVTYWGEKGEIPETVTVNLSKNTAWSLGNEIELSTTEEDEAITFEQGETCDTVKNEEKPPNPLLMEESEQKLLKIIGQTMLPTESSSTLGMPHRDTD